MDHTEFNHFIMLKDKKSHKPHFKTQEHRADLLKLNMARRKQQKHNKDLLAKKEDIH
jgi:hypothetical protein